MHYSLHEQQGAHLKYELGAFAEVYHRAKVRRGPTVLGCGAEAEVAEQPQETLTYSIQLGSDLSSQEKKQWPFETKWGFSMYLDLV